jgi:hypothetical protein
VPPLPGFALRAAYWSSARGRQFVEELRGSATFVILATARTSNYKCAGLSLRTLGEHVHSTDLG